MKMIFVIYNMAVDAEVTLAVRRKGIQFYTKFPRVKGVGPNTGARLDDHVWPGANTAMMIVTDEAAAAGLMTMFQELRDTIGQHEGIYAFLCGVEGVTV